MKTGGYLGVEIGGTKLQLLSTDMGGKVIRREARKVDLQAGAAGILEQIGEVIDTWRDDFSWLAAGVGFGGPVGRMDGRVASSFHVSGWDGFPLGSWLEARTGAPAVVENDTNAAALGEAMLGSGKGFNPVFYTNSGSGVGGGLVAGGSIYHGAAPGESEFGHLRLNKEGTTVEDVASGWAIDRAILEAVERGDTIFTEWVTGPEGGEARHMKMALERGDRAAELILAEASENLAYALSHVVHLFHPEVVVLGGGVSRIGERWRRAVADGLPRYLMKVFQPGPEIRLAALGEDAVPLGAIACAMALHPAGASQDGFVRR